MATLQDILERGEPIQYADGRFTVKVDGAAENVDGLLKDLQGNILTWHKRNCAHYFFVDFKRGHGPAKAKEFLGKLAKGCELNAAGESPSVSVGSANLKITSEFEQREWIEAPDYDRESRKEYFLTVLLTGRGYQFLGAGKIPGDDVFKNGMVDRGPLLSDHPPQTEWQVNHPDRPIDALILLAHNPDGDCGGKDEILTGFRKLVSEVGSISHEDRGRTIQSVDKDPRTGKKWFVEPFGYRDGISQPLFYGRDIEEAAVQSYGQSHRGWNWDPASPLKSVLLPDPNGKSDRPCGSFFVYRKLKQDVKSFYEQVKAMTESLGYEWPAQRNEVLARIMGRYPDGRPLVDGPHFKDTGYNDFDYKKDTSGSLCPFHTHVRKVNPRMDVGLQNAMKHRIVRRGLSYGDPIGRDADNIPLFSSGIEGKGPTGLHGTHFMCAQSDIAEQFEHIQAKWANRTGTSRAGSPGIDPIGGQTGNANHNVMYLPSNDGSSKSKMSYTSFVELAGGEYFFAPSIGFLE